MPKKMKPAELCERLACQHEALRRLGFSADDLYVSSGILWEGVVCWGTTLRVGGKEWNGAVSPCTKPDAVFVRRWQHYVTADIPHLPQEKLEAMWKEYVPLELFQSIVTSIAVKGIEIPALPMLRQLSDDEIDNVVEAWN